MNTGLCLKRRIVAFRSTKGAEVVGAEATGEQITIPTAKKRMAAQEAAGQRRFAARLNQMLTVAGTTQQKIVVLVGTQTRTKSKVQMCHWCDGGHDPWQ